MYQSHYLEPFRGSFGVILIRNVTRLCLQYSILQFVKAKSENGVLM